MLGIDLCNSKKCICPSVSSSDLLTGNEYEPVVGAFVYGDVKAFISFNFCIRNW